MPKIAKMRHCFNCGKEIGGYPDAYHDRFTACHECQHEERDARQQEREEAHEQLDRNMGWD